MKKNIFEEHDWLIRLIRLALFSRVFPLSLNPAHKMKKPLRILESPESGTIVFSTVISVDNTFEMHNYSLHFTLPTWKENRAAKTQGTG